ncbi:MAG: glycoside hydrolase family 3 C-terminal domain-containing protein [Lachnospiraceae bacterium]|nr:glycoside hydrolase family 3 C-terminal domain-containing protein [Lachnospiraceae bacterium]
MIKNAGNLIQESTSEDKPVVYIPYIYDASADSWESLADLDYAANYFEVVTDSYDGETLTRASADELASVDYALVRVNSPEHNDGYDEETGEYLPVSLQYGEYTVTNEAAKEAFANGVTESALETPYGTQYVTEEEDRSYYGQTVTVTNTQDLETILYAAENCEHVIVCIDCTNPMVVSEFEDQVDVILLNFNIVSSTSCSANNQDLVDDAIYNIVTGKAEPSGLLPFQIPADMETVEEQAPDVSRDVECHVDSEGNTYDFTFGLNWSGVISDERTETYGVAALGNEA